LAFEFEMTCEAFSAITPDGSRTLLLPSVRGDRAAAAPFHVTPRGFAGPSLLAMILFEMIRSDYEKSVFEVRSASALEPAERTLRLRRKNALTRWRAQ
jgi:hypothetical protein